jgi:S-(hydroxymethyl)glutathione dehydrogenase / alcohol dehydrogenase
MKLPIKYKAAVLVKNNQPLKIYNIEFKGPLKIGQVLTKIEYSGICGKQIEEIQGKMGKDKFLPHCLGHEAVGEVKMIGPGVKNVRAKDKVVIHWMKGSGIESETPELIYKNKKINAGLCTTFSEYSVLSENRVTKIKNTKNLKLMSLFGCVVSTGIGCILNEANVKPYHRVAIIGVGSLGLSLIMGSRLAKAREIIVFDNRKNAEKRVKKFGADKILKINFNKYQNYFDKVFISSTDPKNIEYGYSILSEGGELFVVGVPSPKEKIKINSLAIHFNKKLRGSFGGSIIPQRDIPTYVELQEKKIINLKDLVVGEYKFKDINIPIMKMLNKKSLIGRYLIKM